MKFFKSPTTLFLLSLLLSAGAGQLFAASSGSITGNVYCDMDKNGVCDCEEGGLEGIPVRIYVQHCSGTPLQTVSTDVKGNFEFDRFDPGTYCVMVQLDYVCGGRVPTTANFQQVELVDGETVTLPAFGYSEYGQ
jgi:hypothetical protein